MLSGKRILLGICGSIAAYKAAEWVRELRRAGAEVTVIMTGSAARFVTPLTFAALSGHPVHTEIFAAIGAEAIPHINLAREQDLLLIGPATAQTIARLAHGQADDLLSAVSLAARIPVIVCPAMNSNMYLHPATQDNLKRLASFGYRLVEPACGKMACREEGPGRLPEWPVVREAVLTALSCQDLGGRQILVTAGPTHEPLDPVRYLGNRSTGKMGFMLAATAQRRGAKVTLISGPSSLSDPPGVSTVRISTATEMAAEVLGRAGKCDTIVMAAAVSDFRPSLCSTTKIKKGGAKLSLDLTANQDILKTLGERKSDGPPGRPILVGFAAETGSDLEEGRRKLRDKNLDLLAFNDVSADDAGFAVETNRIVILDRNGGEEILPLLDKERAADMIWNRVAKLLDDSLPIC